MTVIIKNKYNDNSCYIKLLYYVILLGIMAVILKQNFMS